VKFKIISVDTLKRQTPRQHFNQFWRCHLSTFSKDRSQTGWRPVHLWWTN